MNEQLPIAVPDEPLGDQADQASRLQMAEEQEAIRAALAGHVHGTDAYDDDRSPVVDPLEGPEPLDAESVDASDDPVYGGGMPLTDPEEAALVPAEDRLAEELAMTGSVEDAEPMALDEGGTVADDRPLPFEADGDPDALAEELLPVDDETAAEDIDALIDVLDLGHDLDDPQNPDGYGVPPDPEGGAAVVDQAELRNPVDDD